VSFRRASPWKIVGGIPGIIGRFRRPGVFAGNALETGPGFQQRPVDDEILVGEQAGLPRLTDHGIQEGRRHIAFQQAVAVLAEGRRRPDRVVHPQTDEPRNRML
jgi:hypothetical protein